MNRALICLALTVTLGLAITATLQAQNADRYASQGDIQPAAFDEQAGEDSAAPKQRSPKPLLQGLFGRRSNDKDAPQEIKPGKRHPKNSSARQPTPVDVETANVPRRVKRDANTGSLAVDNQLSESQEIASDPIEKKQVPDGSASSDLSDEEVRVSDKSSSRRSQPAVTDPSSIAVESARIESAPIESEPIEVAPIEAEVNATVPIEAAPIQATPIQRSTPSELSGQPNSQPIDARDGGWDDTAPRPIQQGQVAAGLSAQASPNNALPQGDGLLVSRKSAVLIVETLGPRHTVIGKESSFQVKLQNLGDVAATGVDVRVKTPQWAEITSANSSLGAPSPAGSSEQPLIWRVDSLEARGTAVLNLKIIPRQSDSFDLAVAWTMQPTSSQTMIQVKEPRLEIGIAGPGEVRFGETKIYTLTISNPGTGDAENVKVKLMPIEGGDQPMAVQDVGTIRAGENMTLEVELTARQAGFINIDAAATADLGLQAKAAEKVLVRRANLTIDVVGPPVKYTGTIAEYKFRIANDGNAPAENINIAVNLPAGSEFVDGTNGGRFDQAAKKVSWNIDALPSQREMIFTVRSTLTQAGANVLNVSANADRELADSGSASTVVETMADLKLEISDPRGPIPVGEKMVYELRLWNRGSKAARDVEVVAFFSEGVEPISVEGGGNQMGNGQVLFNPIPILGVGEEIKLKIAASANRGGNHIFRAEVNCSDAGTRLAAEETTHFYDKHSVTAATGDSQTIRR